MPGDQAESVVMVSAAARRLRSNSEQLRVRVPGDQAWVPTVPGRRGLQVCLGLVWLLDAVLQYQPFMFGPFFVTQVIEPSTVGSPAIVSSSVIWASELMLRHIVLYNALFATIQLLIAVGILVPRTRKAALAASIIWALAVWWFGESLGGIFTGVSPLAGLPGGVVLYALLALVLWPATPKQTRQPVPPASSGALGRKGAYVLWLIVWGSFTCFLLLPANRSAAAIAQIFAVTDGQPGWITAIMNDLSGLAGQRGFEISVVLASFCAFTAIGILTRRLARLAVVTAIALGLLIWIAEGLGGILTGRGTDPNSGLLLILLAASFWPRSQPSATHMPPSAQDRGASAPTCDS
jgi:hypothetical protein